MKSLWLAALAAVIVFIFMIVVSKGKNRIPSALAFTAVALIIYIPAGYYLELMLYRRRQHLPLRQTVKVATLEPLGVSEVAEPYIRRRAMRHLEKGRVVIFAAGTGNPFFTTDTAAALRASEIHAEIILMAKNGVEGVYTADPALDPNAQFIPEITHMEALERRLRVMDSTALALCMENSMPLNVFNMDDEDSLARIISGERVGTLVSSSQGDGDGS